MMLENIQLLILSMVCAMRILTLYIIEHCVFVVVPKLAHNSFDLSLPIRQQTPTQPPDLTIQHNTTLDCSLHNTQHNICVVLYHIRNSLCANAAGSKMPWTDVIQFWRNNCICIILIYTACLKVYESPGTRERVTTAVIQ